MLSYGLYGRRATKQPGVNPSTDDPAGDHPADHPLLLPGVYIALPVLHPGPPHTDADRCDGDAHGDIHARSADADAGGNADPVVATDLYPHSHAHADSHAHAHSYADADPDGHSDADGDAHSHADGDANAYRDGRTADADPHGHPDADGDTHSHTDRDTHSHADRDTHFHADRDTHFNANGYRNTDRNADRDAHPHADGNTGVPHASAARRFAGAHRLVLANSKSNMDTLPHSGTCRVHTSDACPLLSLVF